jgi:hypothetical protein
MSDPDMYRRLEKLVRWRDDLASVEIDPINRGSAFPAGWPDDVPFFRTDLGLWCFYDGSQWLTVDEYQCTLGLGLNTTLTFTVTPGIIRVGIIRSDYQIRATRAQAVIATGGANSGAAYASFDIKDSAATTLWSFSTQGDAASSDIFESTTTFSSQPGGLRQFLFLDMTITGAPGATRPGEPVVWYRLIVT